MKRLTLLLSCIGLFFSCATYKPLPEADLDARAGAVLDGRSRVEPLEVTLDTDYVAERLTLVRIYITTSDGKTSHTTAADDDPLGVYFGNGLFMDDVGNLSLRLDKLAGITPEFRGRSEYRYYPPMGSTVLTRTVTHSPDLIEVKEAVGIFGNYSVNPREKKINVFGQALTFQDDGKVELCSSFLPLPFTGVVWESTADGVARSSWGSILGLIPIPEKRTISMKGTAATDSDKKFLVENNGTYLRFAYTKGDTFSYRIYRTPSMILILDETSGNMSVIRVTSGGLEWKQAEGGLFGKTDKLLDCSLKVFPGK